MKNVVIIIGCEYNQRLNGRKNSANFSAFSLNVVFNLMLYRFSVRVFLLAWLGVLVLERSSVPYAPHTLTDLVIRVSLLVAYVLWHGGLILSTTGWGERHTLVTAILLLPFSFGVLAHFFLEPLGGVAGNGWPPPKSDMKEVLFLVSVPLYLWAFVRVFGHNKTWLGRLA